MELSRVFRKQGPLAQLLNVVVAASGTGFVMTAGHGVAYFLVGVESSPDPIEATERFGVLVTWVIHPIAALGGGSILRLLGWRPRVAVVGVLFALTPLWVAWFVGVQFAPIRLAQVVLYMAAGLAPFAIRRIPTQVSPKANNPG